MADREILVVGAGPTGLMLALRLARHGVALRIIEKNPGPGLASRAMLVHARTLEFYDQLSLADKVIGQGIVVKSMRLRRKGKTRAQLDLANFGAGLSPYPFALSYPQDDHERLLVEELKSMGITVQWNTELSGLQQDGDTVTATLRQGGTTQLEKFAYVCGCDGAHSKTRELLNIGFDGGTYQHLFYVADVKLARNTDVAGQVCLEDEGIALQFPIRSTGMNRLIGIVPAEAENIVHPSFADLQNQPERLLNVEVRQVNWFSTYHVHHRVASRFKEGRVFLLGDAGHIHSPAGGQGLNTGLGDAVNLSWKLAEVMQGRAAPALLDSYEPERIAFARQLVATTDRAFSLMVSGGWRSRLMRNLVVPYVIPTLLRFASFKRLAFRTLSQTQISYRGSALSVGQVGQLRAGDRMPFVGALDNFSPLRKLAWQVHIYGKASAACTALCDDLGLPLAQFPFAAAAADRGLHKNALYLLRPDGHVGFASETQDVAALKDYISVHQLRFR